MFSICLGFGIQASADEANTLNDGSGCFVASYYFPNYHYGDPRNEKVKGKGWAEWELVKAAKPRFEGHIQPNIPAWGYTDEADPKQMAQKIDAAADHGINAFIFDWYYYEDGLFLERGVEQGFMKAPNANRLKFGLMWANHDWVNIHPWKLGTPQTLLYPGKLSPAAFDRMCDYVIQTYFTHPSYWKLEGKPYFSIYDLTRLMDCFGSVPATREALDRFRAKTQAAGFPGLHLEAVVWGNAVLPVEKVPADPAKLVADLGFDSVTSYVWIHHVHLKDFPQTDYNYARDKYMEYWDSAEKKFAVPYYPNVTMGWDSSPRADQSDEYVNRGYPFMATIKGNTPERFKEALRMTRERLAKRPAGQRIFNINCWNEWTEGSYLEPDTRSGMKYLEAVRDSAKPEVTGKKHLVELGWDIPNTDFMRRNYESMEADAPFEGVIFKLEARNAEDKTVSSEWAWDATPWKKDWFLQSVDDLKQCRFQRFKHNFIRFNASPGDLDWADDAGWSALANKLAVTAWVACQGGAKGIAPDFESYGKRQFGYDATSGRSYEETAALARKRGAQFVSAIAGEYPDAVLLPLWLNSINIQSGRSDSPDELLAAAPYGLLPAFVNGMLDALPPGMIIVDGCENGYYMNSREEYLAAAHEMRSWNGAAVNLVAPENREKYRRQVQAGFGFYLDMFLNEGGTFYFPPLDGSRLKRLHRNLSAAIEAADEYVWVYGEQSRWWNAPASNEGLENRLKDTVGKGRHWEKALPGVTRMIRWAQDPLAAGRDEVRADSARVNLVPNPQFAEKPQTEGAVPPTYIPWQDTGSAGTFTWDPSVGDGSGRAADVRRGTLMQRYPVEPGQVFFVECDCLKKGAGRTDLMIRWQKSDDSWTRWHDDVTFNFKPTGRMENGLEWMHAEGVVTVPEDVGLFVILLDVIGQLSDEDVCWFDNVGLYRLKDLK